MVEGGLLLHGPPAFRHFEPDLRGVFLDELSSCELFVDVGANIGLYACLAASKGKPTIAIEPLPRNLAFLRRNLAANGFADVEVVPLAVGETGGAAKIYGFAEIASMHPTWSQGAAVQSEDVAVTTLDSLIAARCAGRQTFIKMDIEGYEFNALRGATKVLASTPRPVWLIEILPRSPLTGMAETGAEATLKLFADSGYQRRQISESMFLFR